MKFKTKHIGLILGLVSVIFSFLFFGRQQTIYLVLLLGGLFASAIFYLVILSGKERAKSKIIWTIIVVLSICIQQLSEPLLIRASYFIYIKSNENELVKVNNILIEKQGNIDIFDSEINDEDSVLTPLEKDKLQELKHKLNVRIIQKSDKGIYYGLWHSLDVDLGILYCNNNEILQQGQHRITDNWVY